MFLCIYRYVCIHTHTYFDIDISDSEDLEFMAWNIQGVQNLTVDVAPITQDGLQ